MIGRVKTKFQGRIFVDVELKVLLDAIILNPGDDVQLVAVVDVDFVVVIAENKGSI